MLLCQALHLGASQSSHSLFFAFPSDAFYALVVDLSRLEDGIGQRSHELRCTVYVAIEADRRYARDDYHRNGDNWRQYGAVSAEVPERDAFSGQYFFSAGIVPGAIRHVNVRNAAAFDELKRVPLERKFKAANVNHTGERGQ